MITESIDITIRKAINKAGYDLHRLDSNPTPYYHLTKCLAHFGIDLVLDVGANIGQFATGLRNGGYTGKLVSFEPLSSAHRLLEQAATRDPHWIVHPRGAIGDHDGKITMNVAQNSVSSSPLPMTETHLSAASESVYVGQEHAPLFSLDTVTPPYLLQAQRTLLKIDTQGFEWQVLDGAQQTLPHIHGILCELSLQELYAGQHLWLDMIQRIENAGFNLWSVHDGFSDRRNGRTLQLDATFFRC